MNISSIELYSLTSTEGLEFVFSPDEASAKYQIRGIVGLDAPEITPKYYAQSKVYTPGMSLGVVEPQQAKFYDLGLKPRTIAIRVTLNPNWENFEDYGIIRDELYKIIASSRSGKISLNLKDQGSAVARVDGFVTKFEVDHMTKLPEATITIQCDDPMLRGLTTVYYGGSPSDPIFTGTDRFNIPDGISTAPHGFTMEIAVNVDSPTLTIQDDPADPSWVFQSTNAFLAGEIVYFSSEASNKYFYRVNFGTPKHLVDTLSPDSHWPVIFPGNNEFYLLESDKFGITSVRFYPAFWGV